MQSYSSCLPPFLLLQGVKQRWINRKYDVMDACSAPGNKTIQLAEYLGSNGRVFAFEKNIKRYELLQNTLSKYHASNVKPKNQDFLQVTPCSKYKKVKFIMLDPSCSGSGMLTNFARDSHQKEQH
jgi:25S rRNA (cytosine2278-C5)-methyltransferase